MIDGVIVTPLQQIVDERGKVMHMLRRDSPIFREFGEIYFSTVNPGAIKAWHIHKIMTLNYAVPHGLIKFVLHDDRVGSPTHGRTEEIILSPERYCLVTVPPLIWNGFKGLGSAPSIVANCATIPYDPAEIDRRPPSDLAIGYEWGIRHG
jgi:dTDP-4-dehydrorhamnose 3,5-epimerase